MIEKGTPGFTVGRDLQKMGWWASDTAELFFEDVRVPVGNLIGPENAGFMLIMANFQAERLSLAIMAYMTAQMALEACMDYVKDRVTFGKPLSKHQVIRHKLAEMATRVDVAREYSYRVAARMQAGKPAINEVCMAKNFATDVADYVTHEAVQIFGGMGYMRECVVERLYRDNRILSHRRRRAPIMDKIMPSKWGCDGAVIRNCDPLFVSLPHLRRADKKAPPKPAASQQSTSPSAARLAGTAPRQASTGTNATMAPVRSAPRMATTQQGREHRDDGRPQALIQPLQEQHRHRHLVYALGQKGQVHRHEDQAGSQCHEAREHPGINRPFFDQHAVSGPGRAAQQQGIAVPCAGAMVCTRKSAVAAPATPAAIGSRPNNLKREGLAPIGIQASAVTKKGCMPGSRNAAVRLAPA